MLKMCYQRIKSRFGCYGQFDKVVFAFYVEEQPEDVCLASILQK